VRISGSSVISAPADRVWEALNDPAVLVRTIPGCEQLEALSPSLFRLKITAGVASIKGSYLGEVELSNPSPPTAFTLRASGAGAPGTVSAEVRITLSSGDGVSTTVSYDADAVVGGAVGGVGQRVITAVAKRTAGEFFSALDATLTRPTAPGPTPPAAEVFTRPPSPARAPGSAQAAVLGAGIALAGVAVGWLIGRRGR
jgi:carbon monoxide dehydrogenase subunit G